MSYCQSRPGQAIWQSCMMIISVCIEYVIIEPSVFALGVWLPKHVLEIIYMSNSSFRSTLDLFSILEEALFISSAFIVEVLGKKLLSPHQRKQENKSSIITLLQDMGGNVFCNFICILNRGLVSLLIFYCYVFKIKMYHLPKE